VTSKWEQLKRQVARDRDGEQRSAKPRFLLCFEDAVSAPNYFEALRKHKKLRSETFIVDFDASCSDPDGIVKRAMALREEYLKTGDLDEGDEIWCVVDVNGHTTMNDARQRADANGISLAISNPCFEYWLLLHVEDTAPPAIKCDEMIRNLKKHEEFKEYNKTKFDHSTIVDRADLAAGRAKKQFDGKAEPDPTKCCPCTMIFNLIAAIAKIP